MPAPTMDVIVSLAKRRGFVFPVVRRLRRPGQHLGLRPARRRAEEQRQARLVALGGLRPRRHGGPGRRDPDEPAGLEVLGPRRRRSRDPMTDCRNCKPAARRPRVRGQKGPDPGLARSTASPPSCSARSAAPPLTEARQFNLMFRRPTWGRSTRTTASVAYLRPETAQGIFVNFGNVADTTRRKLPFGDRADRQELPQRDHARQLHVSRPRVRADGDGVLRRMPGRGRVVRRTGSRSGCAGGPTTWACGPDGFACDRTTPTSCPTTPSRRPTSSTTSRWVAELEGIADRTDLRPQGARRRRPGRH